MDKDGSHFGRSFFIGSYICNVCTGSKKLKKYMETGKIDKIEEEEEVNDIGEDF